MPAATLPPIVYFGNTWSTDHRTSSHHIAAHLALRTQLLYIECPGLRAPAATGRDLRRTVERIWQALRGERRTDDGMLVATLLQIPFRRGRLFVRVNEWLARATIRRLLKRQRMSGVVSWAVVPHVTHIAGRLGERLLVYYCIDDYAALPGVDERIVSEMDGELTRRSDLVFVAAATLLESKRAANPSTSLSPHGVDYEHFAQAQDRTAPVAADIADITGPVVGCIALIERWIDIELIDEVAKANPSATVVVIGRIAVPSAGLSTRPNIRWLGPRPYQSLPSYGRRFDVAIIPYRPTRQVMNANPLKLREYLAMGIPIVSVATPEIDQFASLVSIARRREDFAGLVSSALGAPRDEKAVAARMAAARSMSWQSRVDEIVRTLDARLNATAKTRKTRS
jgi:glycosyltransferase involved in cell wall biosynthesis